MFEWDRSVTGAFITGIDVLDRPVFRVRYCRLINTGFRRSRKREKHRSGLRIQDVARVRNGIDSINTLQPLCRHLQIMDRTDLGQKVAQRLNMDRTDSLSWVGGNFLEGFPITSVSATISMG